MTTRLLFVLLMAVGPAACYDTSAPLNPAPTPTPTGSTVTIVPGASNLTTNAFTPNPITVSAGTKVTWVNTDNITHTSVSDTGVWSSGNIAAGATFSFTFSTAGTYPYHCVLHPNMVGSVVVQ